VDVHVDVFKNLDALVNDYPRNPSGTTNLHALRDIVRNRMNAAEGTEILPLLDVADVRTDVSCKVGFEEFNAVSATLLWCPVHVTSQALELSIEGSSRVRFEAIELTPDVVAIDGFACRA
jgi:hypothetical protein